MKVFITGAGGLIGSALSRALQRQEHTVVPAPRSSHNQVGVRSPVRASEYARLMAGCDAVVNLAGESVFGRRWTAARRRALRNSRVELTERLVEGMRLLKPPPRVFVSASAVGYYGDRRAEVLTESSLPGSDFLARLCVDWEAAALRAHTPATRVACLRISIVLARRGGALAQMLPPFRLGLGGPVGNGSQFFPWIHIDDAVAVILAALTDARYQGSINLAAPEAVTSREFAHALGRALRRPAVMPLSAWALRLRYGSAAQPLLASLRIRPKRLEELGFAFRFSRLAPALSDCTGGPAPSGTRG